MRFLSFGLLFLLFPSLSWAQLYDAYLDIEDDQVVSIFNQPGHNWKTCQETNKPTNCAPGQTNCVTGKITYGDSCKAVAWPDNKSKLKFISEPRVVPTYNHYKEEMVDETYVKVEYDYEREVNGKTIRQKGAGWIDMAYLRKDKLPPFFPDVKPSPKKPKCEDSNVRQKDPLDELGAIAESATNQGIGSDLDKIGDVVGACAVERKGAPVGGAIPYDQHVMPLLEKAPVPDITKPDGSKLTRQDLIDIDALARTMYGEMASCYKHGLHYPMTVAKIIHNRSQASSRHGEFIRGRHRAGKGTIAKTATSPSQFSVWYPRHGKKPNPSIYLAMCPPRKLGEKFWNGSKTPKFEHDIWKQTLKIAAETVMAPKTIKRRTNDLPYFFYTSGMGKFFKMKQVKPTVEGRKVDKNACMEVWSEH
ncbi:MAG: hypothetical protein ACLGGX_08795 [Bdellovibrionia bacterium]